MKYNLDKIKVRESLDVDKIFELLQDWGGEPQFCDFGIISSTICHNLPGEGSRKLYYYENTGLFRCFTECADSFDIFQLCIKIQKIQKNRDYDLNDAVRYIASRFNLSGEMIEEESEKLEDWKILDRYEIASLKNKKTLPKMALKEYDNNILNKFTHPIIVPWIEDNISQDIMEAANIGYYAGGNQITIPHYDNLGRLIGIRGRTLALEDAEMYGKYRPLYVNKTLFSHPLGLNLYNLNRSKNNISIFKKAIIFESEKSCLQYQTAFGSTIDISTACCGFSISDYQVELLLDLGVQELIIALDRQFINTDDIEFKHLTKNLLKIRDKYKNYTTVSFIFDKHKITPYKASPMDCGKDIFLKLYKERIIL